MFGYWFKINTAVDSIFCSILRGLSFVYLVKLFHIGMVTTANERGGLDKGWEVHRHSQVRPT